MHTLKMHMADGPADVTDVLRLGAKAAGDRFSVEVLH